MALNQPKSNLFAGISDTLKREPSESVVATSLLLARTVEPSQSVRGNGDPYGYLPFPTYGVSLGRASQAWLARANRWVRPTEAHSKKAEEIPLLFAMKSGQFTPTLIFVGKLNSNFNHAYGMYVIRKAV